MKYLSKKSIVVFFVVILIIILLAEGCLYFFQKNKAKTFSSTEEYKDSLTAFNSNNTDQAIKTLQTYLQKNPNDVSALLLLAASYVQTGSLTFQEKKYGDMAIEVANKVLTQDPNNAEAYRIIGYANEIEQNYTAAFPAYNKALSLNPKSAEIYSNRGHAYLLYGDAKKAQADFESAVKINPNLDDALVNLGSIYISQNKFDDAKKVLNQASASSPNLRLKASAEQMLGVIDNINGDWLSAKAHLEKSISYYENLAASWVELAQATFYSNAKIEDKTDVQNGLNDTFNDITKAFKINPNQTSAYVLLGEIFVVLNNTTQAKTMFDAASATVDKDITLSKDAKEAAREQIKIDLGKIK